MYVKRRMHFLVHILRYLSLVKHKIWRELERQIKTSNNLYYSVVLASTVASLLIQKSLIYIRRFGAMLCSSSLLEQQTLQLNGIFTSYTLVWTHTKTHTQY